MSPRAGLDRAAVVRAAAALADRAGLEEVTLARLADELGVRTPSLYNHVAGLDGLRRDLALLGLRQIAGRLAEATSGQPGGEGIVALGDAYRAFAKERPGLYAAAMVRAPGPEDAELQAAAQGVLDVVLAALAPYGQRGDDALHATRGLRSLLHGFVALELAGGFGLPLDLDESFHRLLRVFIQGLHRDERGALP